jgi:DNA polymerase III sliding clamp (beta) subunit (PCNA family)
METIKRIRVNSDPDTAAITLNIMPSTSGAESWVLVVQAKDRAGNASKEVMLCDWNGEKTRSISFNHNYLYDMLALLSEESVVMALGPDSKTSKSPILIEDQNFKGVIQQIAVVL